MSVKIPSPKMDDPLPSTDYKEIFTWLQQDEKLLFS